MRVLAALVFAFCASAAPAQERILDFASEVAIRSDGSLDVVEVIRVNVEGRRIQRGIFRDFPTRYEDRSGANVVVPFEVVSVERNGEPEPYRIENLRNGVRVRIGVAEVMLPRGQHAYRNRVSHRAPARFFREPRRAVLERHRQRVGFSDRARKRARVFAGAARARTAERRGVHRAARVPRAQRDRDCCRRRVCIRNDACARAE
jgi:hypothetical protein